MEVIMNIKTPYRLVAGSICISVAGIALIASGVPNAKKAASIAYDIAQNSSGSEQDVGRAMATGYLQTVYGEDYKQGCNLTLRDYPWELAKGVPAFIGSFVGGVSATGNISEFPHRDDVVPSPNLQAACNS
jgi:hypothetical protein